MKIYVGWSRLGYPLSTLWDGASPLWRQTASRWKIKKVRNFCSFNKRKPKTSPAPRALVHVITKNCSGLIQTINQVQYVHSSRMPTPWCICKKSIGNILAIREVLKYCCCLLSIWERTFRQTHLHQKRTLTRPEITWLGCIQLLLLKLSYNPTPLHSYLVVAPALPNDESIFGMTLYNLLLLLWALWQNDSSPRGRSWTRAMFHGSCFTLVRDAAFPCVAGDRGRPHY